MSYYSDTPSTEKKSMKLAAISRTLRLPTRVNPSRPAFSLDGRTEKLARSMHFLPYISIFKDIWIGWLCTLMLWDRLQCQTCRYWKCLIPEILAWKNWKMKLEHDNIKSWALQRYGIHFTSQPTPRLSTEGGIGVALANLDAAINVAVDCRMKGKKERTFVTLL